VGTRLGQLQAHGVGLVLEVAFARDCIVGTDFGGKGIAHVFRQQLGADADRARGVLHVHHRVFVIRLDLDGCVRE